MLANNYIASMSGKGKIVIQILQIFRFYEAPEVYISVILKKMSSNSKKVHYKLLISRILYMINYLSMFFFTEIFEKE